MASNRIDRVARVEALRGFDDGWCWLVRSATPCSNVNCWLLILAESKVDNLAQRARISANRRMNSVRVRFRQGIISFFGLGRDKDRHDGCRMAGFVKVFQIKAVVPSLIEVRALVTPLAYFEFDRENDSGHDQNGIDAASDPRDVELEVNAAGEAGQTSLQNLDLNFPGIALLELERKLPVRGHGSQDLSR